MLSIFDQGPPVPCPRPFNLAAHVMRRADDVPDKTALTVLGSDAGRDATHTFTFAGLEAAARGIGTGLRGAGLKSGDIVLMRLGNTVDFPLAYLGAIAAGIVPVPTSAQLTQEEVAQMVQDLPVKAILRDPAIASVPGPHEIDLTALRAMRGFPPCAYELGDPERLAYVVYTSGTAGQPRAVGHAHRAIWARRMMIDGWTGLSQEDRMLHAGAFNWTYTLGTGLMDPWTVGATALIPAPGTPIPDLPELVRRAQATLFAAAPGVYRKILASHDHIDLPDLRHGLSAGEKLSDPLRDRWRRATGTEILEAYGMSEVSTFISAAPGVIAPKGTLGRPQRGRRIAILAPDGPAPLGTPGTIAVHSSDPGLMLGYLNAPQDTAARIDHDWFLTGDQGAMSETGDITYLGRDDDMMNAGGYRVSPLEVEAALAHMPGIEHIAVTEVDIKPDVRIIVAFYTGTDPLDEADLQAYANAHLARYKQPRAYVHLDTLPTGANGKVLRRALKPLFPRQDCD